VIHFFPLNKTALAASGGVSPPIADEVNRPQAAGPQPLLLVTKLSEKTI